jgi:hypothetical protein
MKQPSTAPTSAPESNSNYQQKGIDNNNKIMDRIVSEIAAEQVQQEGHHNAINAWASDLVRHGNSPQAPELQNKAISGWSSSVS